MMRNLVIGECLSMNCFGMFQIVHLQNLILRVNYPRTISAAMIHYFHANNFLYDVAKSFLPIELNVW